MPPDTWWRDDCACPVRDPSGDGCAGTANTDEPTHLCRHCLAHRAGGTREALEDIYDSARYVFDGNHGTPESAFKAGYCRWCGAPPPDADHDHDMACPAAKAGYALNKPGYHDWMDAAERMGRAIG